MDMNRYAVQMKKLLMATWSDLIEEIQYETEKFQKDMSFQWDCYSARKNKEVYDRTTAIIQKEFLDVKVPLGNKLDSVEDEIHQLNMDTIKEKEELHVEFLGKLFEILSYIPVGVSIYRSKIKPGGNEDDEALTVVTEEIKDLK